MHLTYSDVNQAFYGIVNGIYTRQIPTEEVETRNGPVLQVTEPIIVTYRYPTNRVLFNQARDANPFFHLFESLWMLAGRNDVNSLAYYAKNIASYSDNGQTFNGAYGYRWRRASGGIEMEHCEESVDQLSLLIRHLKEQPNSRRAVLQMWNVEDDLLKIGPACSQCKGTGTYKGLYTPDDPTSTYVEETCEDCDGSGGNYSKDVCCNLSVCFSIRTERRETLGQVDRFLDMTVFNRSNDLIWGMLGANAVHFSFLQEYVANCLKIEVGVYNQISNNLHVYVQNNSKWTPEKWLNDQKPYLVSDTYPASGCSLVHDPETFDAECALFVDDIEHVFREPFIRTVAQPMCLAYQAYKKGMISEAISRAFSVQAPDWKLAALNWLHRRKERKGA